MRKDRAALDWGELQTFLAICESGAIARAAGRLGVQHATVIRRLTALETKIGVPLFERHHSHYALTQAGAALFGNLAGMAPQIAGAVAAVRGTDEELSGLIRLTTTDTLLQGVLGPHLRAFCEMYPSVRLEISVRNALENLARHEVDIAIRPTHRPPDNLVGRHVGDIATAPYASASYLRDKPDAALDALDWIAPDESLSHLEQARWICSVVPDQRVVLRINTLSGMVHAAAHDMGAALLPTPLAEQHAALVPLATLPRHELHTPIWVLIHPGARRVARLRTFAKAMIDALLSDARLRHEGDAA